MSVVNCNYIVFAWIDVDSCFRVNYNARARFLLAPLIGTTPFPLGFPLRGDTQCPV